jgi:hypothetical protein
VSEQRQTPQNVAEKGLESKKAAKTSLYRFLD